MRARAPHVSEALARDVAEAVARLRELDLAKLPGVAETIDWANALAFLGAERLDRAARGRHARRRREGPRGPGARRRPARRGRRRRRLTIGVTAVAVRAGSRRSSRSAASCARAGCPSAPGASSRSCARWPRSGSTDRDSLYWAGRTSLVARRDDLEAYDEAFDDWYRSLRVDRRAARSSCTLPAASPRATTFDWGERARRPRGHASGPTAAEWHGSAEDDEEATDGEESSIRIVASGAEVLRIEVVRRAHRGGARPGARR